MKKMIIAAAVILLLLTGCDNRQKVGVCLRDANDPLTGQYCQMLEQTLSDYTLTVVDAGNDQSKQDQQVTRLLEEKVDILILEPVMTSALDTITQLTQDKGVPVIFVNREPEGDGCYVGCNPAAIGGVQARMVPQNADVNGDGILSYAYITGPQDHLDAQLRSDGCAQALADAGVQAQCLALENTDWSREEGQLRCAAVLAKYGKDVEVIFCGNEALALGAIDAIKDGGRMVGENVYLYGIGGDRQSLMLIRSGDLSGTVSENMPEQMEKLLVAVKAMLNGYMPGDGSYVNHIAIDQTNVETYID